MENLLGLMVCILFSACNLLFSSPIHGWMDGDTNRGKRGGERKGKEQIKFIRHEKR